MSSIYKDATKYLIYYFSARCRRFLEEEKNWRKVLAKRRRKDKCMEYIDTEKFSEVKAIMLLQ